MPILNFLPEWAKEKLQPAFDTPYESLPQKLMMLTDIVEFVPLERSFIVRIAVSASYDLEGGDLTTAIESVYPVQFITCTDEGWYQIRTINQAVMQAHMMWLEALQDGQFDDTLDQFPAEGEE